MKSERGFAMLFVFVMAAAVAIMLCIGTCREWRSKRSGTRKTC